MFIVKVAVLSSSSANAQSRDDSRVWDIPVTAKFLKRMGSNTVQCFEARERADGTLKLGNFAPWQMWAEPNTYEAMPQAGWDAYEKGERASV